MSAHCIKLDLFINITLIIIKMHVMYVKTTEYITLALQSTFFLREMNLVPAESTSITVMFS